MNILSLFDGISCGRLALERAGIPVTNYFASEIDKHAITVAKKNWPTTQHIGSVTDIDTSVLPQIDILIGGSPCQSFSFSGKRNGMSTMDNIEVTSLDQYLELKQHGFSFNGQSYLFWEYIRLLKETSPKYFLLENVKMAKKWETIISDTLGVQPIKINSNLITAQNRNRLYWTNITGIEQPEKKNIVLADIIDPDSSSYSYWTDSQMEKYYNKKYVWKECYMVEPLTGKVKCLMAQMGTNAPKIWHGNRFRRLTCKEWERLQTLPDDYTSGISESQRKKCIGNGWTVDVITHILKNIK